eukprot:3362291-Pyramimonas_sp.AAC.1
MKRRKTSWDSVTCTFSCPAWDPLGVFLGVMGASLGRPGNLSSNHGPEGTKLQFETPPSWTLSGNS